MNGRPILTLVLAPRRPVPKPSSTGFPLAFDSGSNGMQNIEAIYDVTHACGVLRGQNQLIENPFQLPQNIKR